MIQPKDEVLVKHMVDRFLGWRLPENFSPDAGISFKRTFNEHTAHPMKSEPIGTNLFDAEQATAMVRYMLDGFDPTPAAAEARATKATEWTDARLDELSADLLRSATFISDWTSGIGHFYGNLRHAARSAIAELRARRSLPPPEAKDGAAPEAPINLLAELKKAVAATEGAAPRCTRDGECLCGGTGRTFEGESCEHWSTPGAAPSPETGGPDLVPLDVFNEAERTHMAMVWVAAAAEPETGFERVPLGVLTEATGLSAIDVVALEQRIGFLYRQLSVAPETKP